MNVYFPLIIASIQIMIGMQATVTPGNAPALRSLGYAIQHDNLRIYDDRGAYADRVHLVSDLHPMIVLYFRPTDSLDSIAEFCAWVGANIPEAEVIQIGQEPDLSSGMEGYFGGWGMERLTEFAAAYGACAAQLPERAQVIIGLSGLPGWETWLDAFLAHHHPEAVGLHYYAWHDRGGYAPFALTGKIVAGLGRGVPIWITELGYGCVSCVPDAAFYRAQVEFIRVAGADALAAGAERIYYYGYNPSWNHVDLKYNPDGLSALGEIGP